MDELMEMIFSDDGYKNLWLTNPSFRRQIDEIMAFEERKKSLMKALEFFKKLGGNHERRTKG